MSDVPDELKYTAEHEWVRATEHGAGRHHRLRAGGARRRGLRVAARGRRQRTPGAAIGEVESTKSVSDIFAPVSGTVVARNDALDDSPELINSDPYGEGWIMELELRRGGRAIGPAGRRRVRLAGRLSPCREARRLLDPSR